MPLRKKKRPKARKRSEFTEEPAEADAGSRVAVSGVTRALRLLEAFEMREEKVGLTELTRRIRMGKTTGLRLLRTLAQSGYVVQLEDGDWRLAHAAGRLGACCQSSFDANGVVEPKLLALSHATGESAAFGLPCARRQLENLPGSGGRTSVASTSRAHGHTASIGPGCARSRDPCVLRRAGSSGWASCVNWVFGDFQSLNPNPDELRMLPIEASQLEHQSGL